MKKNLTLLVLLVLGTSGSIVFLQKQAEETPIPRLEVSASTVDEEVVPKTQKVLTHEILYPVVRVVDGDTIIVKMNALEERVRLIGVNTPESVDPRRTVQCFGKEASLFLKNTLSEQSVRLELDATQGDRDKYGRLLRYVFLADGTLVNKILIESGYGYEYTYHLPYRYQTEFNQAQNEAERGAQGLWASEACGGNK
ncbi:MAG: thermonuclease family protein [Patescibacteria group bacterium]